MTAAVLSRRKGSFKGIRALDPRRDMGPIADLIESAFPLEFAGPKRILWVHETDGSYSCNRCSRTHEWT